MGVLRKKYLTEQENTFQNEEAFKLVRPSLAEQSENSESSPVTQWRLEKNSCSRKNVLDIGPYKIGAYVFASLHILQTKEGNYKKAEEREAG